MLRITTPTAGCDATIRRVASMPFIFGMPISITTTSGISSPVNCTVSRPSAASPTTVMSGCFSSSARRPSRTTVWSSANRMRMWRIAIPPGGLYFMDLGPIDGLLQLNQRQFRRNQRTAPKLRLEPQIAAQPSNPLFHAEQSEAADESRVETHAIVAHLEAHALALALLRHLHRSRVGVARRIVQGLLHRAVDAGLVLIGEIVDIVVGGDHHV